MAGFQIANSNIIYPHVLAAIRFILICWKLTSNLNFHALYIY